MDREPREGGRLLPRKGAGSGHAPWAQAARGALLGALALAGATVAPCRGARAQSLQDLQQLSIAQLATIDVTSVSRRPEPLSDAPAAIYVITSEDIRRSGAITLPEVLRLAPNLEVAEQSAPDYAISARGFNSLNASNKLLVMIDGRSIYSPLQSGVFWDQLMPPLDDIERIEVISGPGGTQWGANAFNGVINIITKNSRDTQGGLLDFKVGPVDQNGLLQYGGRFGQHGTYRVYGTGFGVGHTDLPGGASAGDGWYGSQAGFRTDWRAGDDELTLQGGGWHNIEMLDASNYGGYLRGRWDHRLDDGSSVQVQLSADDQERIQYPIQDAYASYDLQAQHSFTAGRNLVVWGGEFRLIRDNFVTASKSYTLLPPSETLSIGDLFAQDTISLTCDLKLTIGTKIEDSSFSGLDWLPSIRLGWRITDAHFLWAAISRAVRTPSRLDRDLQAAGIELRAPRFESEKVTAYELGYRGRPTTDTSLSVSVYYNVYNDLRVTNSLANGGPPFQLANGAEGDGYGLEAWGQWSVLPWWRLSPGVNLLHKELHLKPGIIDVSQGASLGYDPPYKLSLRSSMDLPHHVELDFGVRAVGRLPEVGIQSYIAGDFRVAWHVTPKVELSLAGYNVFSRHAETVTPPNLPQEVRQSIYLGLRAGF